MLKSKKAKADYKRREASFAKTLKEGLPKEYKEELKQQRKETEYLEKNI
jgi:hypothetical protein